MGAKLRYTTEYNGIVFVFLTIPASILIGTVTSELLQFAVKPVSKTVSGADWFEIASFIAGIALATKLGFYAFTENLAAYLHIRRHLKTPVSWEEASALKHLFRLRSGGVFYPGQEVLKLDPAQRKQYLITMAIQDLKESQNNPNRKDHDESKPRDPLDFDVFD